MKIQTNFEEATPATVTNAVVEQDIVLTQEEEKDTIKNDDV